MIRVRIHRGLSWEEKEFRDWNELIEYMRGITWKWIIEFDLSIDGSWDADIYPDGEE